MLLLRERQWPGIFESLSYDINSKPLRPDSFSAYEDNGSSVFSFRLIPDYFKYELTSNELKTKRIKQYNWGYAINLSSYKSSSDYINQQFSSASKRGIKRFIKRLESCFDIEYRLYFGQIDKEHYRFLMDALKTMITRRFEEKGAKHLEMHIWDKINEQTYDQILRKEASLYVIYHGNLPIQISLNYHMGRILFSSISSYDTDYSKFGLGHIEIYKQLDWCCENDYILYEMGVGSTDYKKRWSNTVYNFEHHIIYRKNVIYGGLLAKLEIARVSLKEFLKSKGINEISQRLYKLRRGNISHKDLTRVSPIKKLTESESLANGSTEDVNVESNSLIWIKKYRNDFLYSSVENENDVKVMRIDRGSFLIKGKDHFQKIVRINH